ncbi:MAG TPA: hypothetical protein VH142_02570 [Polyangiaceae bacterium]|nr:hypothetical protein [Polyangiaceae bacterium]
MIGRLFWGSLAVVLVGGTACSGKYDGASYAVADEPRLDTFDVVVKNLDYSCGNLACHGAAGRNLLLYGVEGRRLAPTDVACGRSTTPDEILADYRSVVGLEPEIMSEVVASGGKDPERLTLIRKMNGTESHKGGTVFAIGSNGDLCVRGWLTGSDDPSACNNAFNPGDPFVACP